MKELHAGYGLSEVLVGTSLVVKAGTIVALIGANGAGKTTSMRAISGMIAPTKGEVLLDGVPVQGLPASKIARLGLAHSPEGRKVFGPLSVEDNLLVGAFRHLPHFFGLRAKAATDLAHVYELFPRLAERKRQYAGTLSGGEQQMLAIGRALMARPKVMLLDEPSMGLAPVIVQELFRTIRRLKAEGMTMLLVEQFAQAALDVAADADEPTNPRRPPPRSRGSSRHRRRHPGAPPGHSSRAWRANPLAPAEGPLRSRLTSLRALGTQNVLNARRDLRAISLSALRVTFAPTDPPTPACSRSFGLWAAVEGVRFGDAWRSPRLATSLEEVDPELTRLAEKYVWWRHRSERSIGGSCSSVSSSSWGRGMTSTWCAPDWATRPSGPHFRQRRRASSMPSRGTTGTCTTTSSRCRRCRAAVAMSAPLTPHLEILPDAQRALWPELRDVPPGFVLYGGTGLALRLGHRHSVTDPASARAPPSCHQHALPP